MTTLVPPPIRTSAVPSHELRQRFAERVRIIEPFLRQRLGGEWRAAEVDLVFVHYLYGLVDGSWPTGLAAEQLSLLHELGRTVIDSDAIDCALHSPPPNARATDARAAHLARTLIAAEAFGRRDAQSANSSASDEPDRLLEPNSNVKPIRHAI